MRGDKEVVEGKQIVEWTCDVLRAEYTLPVTPVHEALLMSRASM